VKGCLKCDRIIALEATRSVECGSGPEQWCQPEVSAAEATGHQGNAVLPAPQSKSARLPLRLAHDRLCNFVPEQWIGRD
jgi:hypothetical protein